MAASVLLIVGDKNGTQQKAILEKVIDKAAKIQPGVGPGEMGPVIDAQSMKKILGYIAQSEKEGAEILLDGRSWASKTTLMAEDDDAEGGNWIGPTVILHSNKTDKAMNEEVFGPVLSVYNVSTWQEAIAIENNNPFGNAAAIYTTNGGHAEWFMKRVRASMLGVNIGIPVPREPFSFGGLYGTKSKYGDMDITGDGAIEFFTNRIKITSKWPVPSVPEYIMGLEQQSEENGASGAVVDHANFAGRM